MFADAIRVPRAQITRPQKFALFSVSWCNPCTTCEYYSSNRCSCHNDAIDATRVPRAPLQRIKGCNQHADAIDAIRVPRVWGLHLSRGTKKVAHTVHGFPVLQESLRLLSDLMLPKHETIMNTETLLLLCGEGNMPLVPACFALPAIGNFLQGEDKKKRPISTKKVDIGLFYALRDEVNGSRLPFWKWAPLSGESKNRGSHRIFSRIWENF